MTEATLIHGDAREAMASLPAQSVDAIVTDPPYNVGKNFGNGSQADRRDDYYEWLWGVWEACGRVAKDGAFLIYTNRIRHLEMAFNPPSPWEFFHIAVWHKPLSLAGTFYGIAPHWEPIIIWCKGKPWRPFRSQEVRSDVIKANVVAGSRRDGIRQHPTVKPVELYRELVRWACPPGGMVLDPFCGTGTTLEASAQLGRQGIGIDLSEDYLKLARARLEATQPAFLGI